MSDSDQATVKQAGLEIIQDSAVTPRRSADWKDVVWHSITAMIGAGVLGLPNAISHLGWPGGIIFLLFSIWVSYHTYILLVNMHEVADLDCKSGRGIRRLDRYDQLAEYVLGPKKGRAVLLPFQMAACVGTACTYAVVGGDNMAAFAAGVTPGYTQVMGKWTYYILFGVVELLLSMLPTFNDLRLVSLLGAVMSFAYCTIAVAMSATITPGPDVNYNPSKVQAPAVTKAMAIFNAMSSVFFAYGGHNIALEIQATIPIGGKNGNSSVPAMVKGVRWTFVATGLCYFSVAILGFWAFGTDVNRWVLMAFKHGPHHWVVAMANMMVVVHVAAAYQVYSQPVFQLIEGHIRRARAGNDIPVIMQFGMRAVYVAVLTVVAILVPFVSYIMGLVGAIAVTPTTFLLPPLLWIMYSKPKVLGFDWSINWFLVIITGILGVLGTVGSVYGMVEAWKTEPVFSTW